RQLLPVGAALLDFFVYSHTAPDPKTKGRRVTEDRLVAFVVRPDREVVRVELGAFGPIRDAIEKWRVTARRRSRPLSGPDDPAVVLRDKLWVPIVRHLGGAKTVLVSPDRDLARLPFAALPGSKGGTYLIEEVAVAVLPVPQFLPGLVAPA